jgi:hypothetical protein
MKYLYAAAAITVLTAGVASAQVTNPYGGYQPRINGGVIYAPGSRTGPTYFNVSPNGNFGAVTPGSPYGPTYGNIHPNGGGTMVTPGNRSGPTIISPMGDD